MRRARRRGRDRRARTRARGRAWARAGLRAPRSSRRSAPLGPRPATTGAQTPRERARAGADRLGDRATRTRRATPRATARRRTGRASLAPSRLHGRSRRVATKALPAPCAFSFAAPAGRATQRRVHDALGQAWVLAGIFVEAAALALIPFVIVRRKEPSSTAAWILALVFLPGAGALLFLMFGRDRLRLPMQKKRATGRALAETLHAARGPLSADAREAALARLESPVERGLFRVGAALSGAEARPGNAATLLVDGDATYRALGDAIDAAEHHVFAEYYLVRRGATADWFRDALVRAARRGVEVKLLVDGYGSFWIGRRWLAPLREAGVEGRVLPARAACAAPADEPAQPPQDRRGDRPATSRSPAASTSATSSAGTSGRGATRTSPSAARPSSRSRASSSKTGTSRRAARSGTRRTSATPRRDRSDATPSSPSFAAAPTSTAPSARPSTSCSSPRSRARASACTRRRATSCPTARSSSRSRPRRSALGVDSAALVPGPIEPPVRLPGRPLPVLR